MNNEQNSLMSRKKYTVENLKKARLMPFRKYTVADVKALREETGCSVQAARYYFENLERREFLNKLKNVLENDTIEVKTAVLLLIETEIKRL